MSSKGRIGDHNHRYILALAAASGALALTGCGASGTPSHGSGSKGGSVVIKFADCMRSHGAPNFPDPSAGGGIQINAGSGINPQSPAFQSAQGACAKLMPGGGPGRPHSSERRRLEMVQLAECMREHGLSTFPDPIATAPSPGAGLGLAFGGPGSFIAVPQSLMQSPAFNEAAAACNFPGAGKASGAKRASTS